MGCSTKNTTVCWYGCRSRGRSRRSQATSSCSGQRSQQRRRSSSRSSARPSSPSARRRPRPPSRLPVGPLSPPWLSRPACSPLRRSAKSSWMSRRPQQTPALKQPLPALLRTPPPSSPRQCCLAPLPAMRPGTVRKSLSRLGTTAWQQQPATEVLPPQALLDATYAKRRAANQTPCPASCCVVK